MAKARLLPTFPTFSFSLRTFIARFWPVYLRLTAALLFRSVVIGLGSSPSTPIQFLLRHRSYLSRNLPIQSVTVAESLVIVAATAPGFLPALTRPLIFDPKISKWSFGPELGSPRRWCAAGTSRGSVYVASGIGSHYSSKVAKSVEKWDFIIIPSSSDKFEEMRTLKDGRFSRDAIEAVGYKGKLCMVNVKGDAVKEGAIYNTEEDTVGYY